MDNLYKLYDMGFKVARNQWKHETVLIDRETERPVGILVLDVFCYVDFDDDFHDVALLESNGTDSSICGDRLASKFKSEKMPEDNQLTWANVRYVYIDKAYRGRNLGGPFIKASCEMFGGSSMITSIAEGESQSLHDYWLRSGFEELSPSEKTKDTALSIFSYEPSFYEKKELDIQRLQGRCIKERARRRLEDVSEFRTMFNVRCD